MKYLFLIPPVLIGGYLLTSSSDFVCCHSTPIPDVTPPNMQLCRITGYIGWWVPMDVECPSSNGYVNVQVRLAPANKIFGSIGDANLDGDCDLYDLTVIVSCFEKMGDHCCVFDYDKNSKINLFDFAEFQRAFGSGSSYWAKTG